MKRAVKIQPCSIIGTRKFLFGPHVRWMVAPARRAFRRSFKWPRIERLPLVIDRC